MFYALGEKDGRKFVCITSGDRGSTELSSDERNFVLQSLPVEGEWIECVWDYDDPEMESKLESLPEFEKGKKAQDVLDYCINEGFLDD